MFMIRYNSNCKGWNYGAATGRTGHGIGMEFVILYNNILGPALPKYAE